MLEPVLASVEDKIVRVTRIRSSRSVQSWKEAKTCSVAVIRIITPFIDGLPRTRRGDKHFLYRNSFILSDNPAAYAVLVPLWG